ncbi:hypothetical protein VE00_09834 [Pseudogymnoascus sp. WSF 3629]|nr:hypothetical protein VE00_09834 [Pseudogymnoascus sp. WSF 3629]
MSHPTPTIPPSTLTTLSTYTACDISDALLALHLPHGGFIPDLSPLPPPPTSTPLIGLASTLLYLPLTPPLPASTPSPAPPSNIPPGSHWTDLVPTDTILIQSGPPSHAAMLGGILAMRLKYRGVKAVIAHGRVRDVGEIREGGLPVWSLGTSTVGSGGGVKAHAVDVAVEVGGVRVRAGDVVVADPGNGVVVIPAERVGEVLALLPGLGEADEKVKEAVRGGMGVSEAFRKFRK